MNITLAVFAVVACFFMGWSILLDEKIPKANYREFHELIKRSDYCRGISWVIVLLSLAFPGWQGLWVFASCMTLRMILGVLLRYEGSPSNHRG